MPWRRFPLSMYGLNHLVYRPDAPAAALADLKTRVQQGIIAAPSDDCRPPNIVQDAVIRRGRLARWIHLEGGHHICRCQSADEVELGMGFPSGASSLPTQAENLSPSDAEWARHTVLGNAFAVDPVVFLLGPLAPIFTGVGSAPPARDTSSMASSFDEVIAKVQAIPRHKDRTPLPGNGRR